MEKKLTKSKKTSAIIAIATFAFVVICTLCGLAMDYGTVKNDVATIKSDVAEIKKDIKSMSIKPPKTLQVYPHMMSKK